MFFEHNRDDNGVTILDGELILIDCPTMTNDNGNENKDETKDQNDNNINITKSRQERRLIFNIFDCICHCGYSYLEEATTSRFEQVDSFMRYFDKEESNWFNNNNDPVLSMQNSAAFGQFLPIDFESKLHVDKRKIEDMIGYIEFNKEKNEYIFTNPTTKQKSLNDGLIFTPKNAAYLTSNDYYSQYSFTKQIGGDRARGRGGRGGRFNRNDRNNNDMYSNSIDPAVYKASKDILKWKPRSLCTIDFLIDLPLTSSMTIDEMSKVSDGGGGSGSDVYNACIPLYCQSHRINENKKKIIMVNGKEMMFYGECILKTKQDILKFVMFYNEFMQQNKEIKDKNNNEEKSKDDRSKDERVWIVECRWIDGSGFSIVRNRLDKMNPNFVQTCDYIYQTMKYGINENDLIEMCIK